MRYHLLLILTILLGSCGSQKLITSTRQKLQLAQQTVAVEKEKINSVSDKVAEKSRGIEMDSITKTQYDSLLTTLSSYLKVIDQESKILEIFLTKRSNFTREKYAQNVKYHVNRIDSFNHYTKIREQAFELMSEAVAMKTYHQFNQAAFFGPGKYKIPPEATEKLEIYMLPILDSMVLLANKYRDLPRWVSLVFVGYSDATGISEGGELYQELSTLLGQTSPSKEAMNRALSDLRAKELLINLRTLTYKNSSKFNGFSPEMVNFYGYGRGEALPSNTIRDYKDSDERRRIVVLYWSVLPNIGFSLNQ